MHPDFAMLLARVERPDLTGWERRAVLTVLEQLADTNPLTYVDRIRFGMIRDRVLRMLGRASS